jgi:hypothetical protein
MNKYLAWRSKPKVIKLWIYFTYSFIVFGLFNFFENRYQRNETLQLAIVNGALAGLLYAIPMTILIYFSRRRFKRITQNEDMVSQNVILTQALKTSELPKDEHTLEILPNYIEHSIVSNKRSRIFSVLVFGAMTCLSIFLVIDMNSLVWIIGTVFFIAIGAYCYMQPKRQIQRLELLSLKLKAK